MDMKGPLCACGPRGSNAAHSGTLLYCDDRIVTQSYGRNQACSVMFDHSSGQSEQDIMGATSDVRLLRGSLQMTEISPRYAESTAGSPTHPGPK